MIKVIAIRLFSWAIILFLMVDSLGKVFKFSPYLKGTIAFGYSEAIVPILGIYLLVTTIFLITSRFSVLGALMLTAYLGGAVATSILSGIGSWIFPIIFCCLTWISLLLQGNQLVKNIVWQIIGKK